MSWETELLESAEDLDITQVEVQEIMSDFVVSALRGFVVLGIMTMGIKGFYNVMGGKKIVKNEKEVLEMAETIW